MKSAQVRLASAFTLVELLVVVGIIALLISILIPTLARARVQALRTRDLSNARQFVGYVVMYSNSNKGWYPIGAPGIDNNTKAADWVSWFHAGTAMSLLGRVIADDDGNGVFEEQNNPLSQMKADRRVFSCEAWKNTNIDTILTGQTFYESQVGKKNANYQGQVLLGWNYLANRHAGQNTGARKILDKQTYNWSTQVYKFPKKMGDKGTSRTLITCRTEAHMLPNFGSRIAHMARDEQAVVVTGLFAFRKFDKPTKPIAGIVCGYTDGSARWVNWGDLGFFQAENNTAENAAPYDPTYR